MQVGVYWKLARPDGWDFYTGKTINYRESVGRVVHAPKFDGELALCGPGILHASRDPLDCLQWAQIPCSAYKVQGRPILRELTKFGFTALKVLYEIPEAKLNELFKFNYAGAIHPFDPRTITPPTIIDEQIRARVQEWNSAWNRAWDGAWNIVRDSGWDGAWNIVRDSVRDGVWDGVWDIVRDIVRDIAWDSVRALEAAYIGTLFPINAWEYTNVNVKGYPFQAAIDLITVGLIPIRDYEGTSYLLGGKDCKVLWKNKLKVAV